ncbi:MAG: FAD binding domain-containing protein [Bacillota bacterium]
MKNFSFINPSNLAEVLEILHQDKNVCLVAGATNVLPFIRNEKINNKTLINIRELKDLRYIRETEDKVLIGALTTIADLRKSEILKKHAPALEKAAENFADPTTRNSATIGGNLANASPAADTAPPLLVLDAMVLAVSSRGERKIPIDEFFTGVNMTALKPDEMIKEIEIPKKPANCQSHFIKLGLRNAMAISLVSAAAALEISSGKIKMARIALGSVAPTPVRGKTVEKFLIGQDYSVKVIEDAAGRVTEDISPISDIRASKKYRQTVAHVVVKRVLQKIGGIQ